MKWKKIIVATLLFVATERFCYYQTGTFSLHKMVYQASPPSPTSPTSSIDIEQPLRFIGAGKQFYAFETADGEYVVKFMKWSRRRPLPYIKGDIQAKRARLASKLVASAHLALESLPHETKLVIPKPVQTFTLIDKLGITHQVPSSSTHFYVQRKAIPFTDYFNNNPTLRKQLIQSFVRTVRSHSQHNISNLDPIIERNYGVVNNEIMLLDFGSFIETSSLNIDVEILPLRNWLQKNYPEYLHVLDSEM